MRKFSNKDCCSINSPPKRSFVEIYHEGNFFVDIFHKGIFLGKLVIKATFCENVQQCCSRFVEFFQQKRIDFSVFFHENSALLWEIFATKQREFWWKFPQNPQNCKNFHAATLPRCKGFCDSDHGNNKYLRCKKRLFSRPCLSQIFLILYFE